MTEQEQRAHEKSSEQSVSKSKPDLIHFTKAGTPRQRQPYAPRRDRGRFSLSARDEWGMRYVADMYALRFDHLLGMVALWDYQEAKRAYQEQMNIYQEHPQGEPPSPPVFHLPERGKVQSMINRWVRAGYAVTDQPYKTDPIWLALTKKGMDELGLPYTPGLPPKAELKERGHLYQVNAVRSKLMKTKTYGDYVWWSERAIKANWEEGLLGERYDQLPDAELYLHGVCQIAVEVELTRKSDARYDVILPRLLEIYPQVLYCVTQKLYSVLVEACEQLDPLQQQRIQILTL